MFDSFVWMDKAPVAFTEIWRPSRNPCDESVVAFEMDIGTPLADDADPAFELVLTVVVVLKRTTEKFSSASWPHGSKARTVYSPGLNWLYVALIHGSIASVLVQ